MTGQIWLYLAQRAKFGSQSWQQNLILDLGTKYEAILFIVLPSFLTAASITGSACGQGQLLAVHSFTVQGLKPKEQLPGYAACVVLIEKGNFLS